jgi:hypothetical protein
MKNFIRYKVYVYKNEVIVFVKNIFILDKNYKHELLDILNLYLFTEDDDYAILVVDYMGSKNYLFKSLTDHDISNIMKGEFK